MFLSRRATQAEYFDSARPMTEITGFYRALSLFNRFFAFAEPFQRFLPRLLQMSDLRALTILDLGFAIYARLAVRGLFLQEKAVRTHRYFFALT